MKHTREIYKEGGVKAVLQAAREGWREGGGTRELLSCVKHDWTLWILIPWCIWLDGFHVTTLALILAVLGATLREWTNRSYTKFLDGYGTMVDQQQRIIGSYQTEHFLGKKHPSEIHAKERASRMN